MYAVYVSNHDSHGNYVETLKGTFKTKKEADAFARELVRHCGMVPKFYGVENVFVVKEDKKK